MCFLTIRASPGQTAFAISMPRWCAYRTIAAQTTFLPANFSCRRSSLHRSGTTEVGPFPIEVKIKVKSDGQECPFRLRSGEASL